MGLAALKADIETAASGHGYYVYQQGEASLIFPALVLGWPTRIELNASFSRLREVDIPISVCVSISAGYKYALADLDKMFDSTLIPDLSAALNGGMITEVGQVEVASYGETSVLFVPLTATAMITKGNT
jgi:hypothetical protein